MAEGGTQSVTCRYFLNGVCKSGSSCYFSHDRQNSRPSTVCRYYVRGECSYGSACRFDHVRQEKVNYRNGKPQCSDSFETPNKIKTLVKCSSASSGNLPGTLTTLSSKFKSNSVPGQCGLRADAPEFIPFDSSFSCVNKNQISSDISFAQMLGGDLIGERKPSDDPDSELCPFGLLSGDCKNVNCPYIHGLMCDMCQLACLHPNDKGQREKHIKECTTLMEAEMEHSFAVARSLEKICGICMETVVDPDQRSKKRFGILPNCNHCFCLDCMRKWRQSKQFENKIVRACPECRVQSDYVVPSLYWVDDKEKEEKDKLMTNYKKALSDKPCKYFKEGEGECPFGNKCFYLHALPDGTKKDVGPPKRRQRINADGDLQLFWDNMVLWDFIEERERRLELLRGSIQTLLLELEFDDLAEDLYFPDDSLSEISDM